MAMEDVDWVGFRKLLEDTSGFTGTDEEMREILESWGRLFGILARIDRRVQEQQAYADEVTCPHFMYQQES